MSPFFTVEAKRFKKLVFMTTQMGLMLMLMTVKSKHVPFYYFHFFQTNVKF